jgi:Na+-transporting methylmalonyl-CoA/oxaloacetate decarboxylase gamma subunit
MYIVIIAWLYVTLMMAVAEATNTTGTVLGAVFTFLLYGVLPLCLVVYLMNTPARRRVLKQREAQARAEAGRAASDPASASTAAAASVAPDAGGEAPADGVAPVREKT